MNGHNSNTHFGGGVIKVSLKLFSWDRLFTFSKWHDIRIFGVILVIAEQYSVTVRIFVSFLFRHLTSSDEKLFSQKMDMFGKVYQIKTNDTSGTSLLRKNDVVIARTSGECDFVEVEQIPFGDVTVVPKNLIRRGVFIFKCILCNTRPFEANMIGYQQLQAHLTGVHSVSMNSDTFFHDIVKSGSNPTATSFHCLLCIKDRKYCKTTLDDLKRHVIFGHLMPKIKAKFGQDFTDCRKCGFTTDSGLEEVKNHRCFQLTFARVLFEYLFVKKEDNLETGVKRRSPDSRDHTKDTIKIKPFEVMISAAKKARKASSSSSSKESYSPTDSPCSGSDDENVLNKKINRTKAKVDKIAKTMKYSNVDLLAKQEVMKARIDVLEKNVAQVLELCKDLQKEKTEREKYIANLQDENEALKSAFRFSVP